MFFYYWVSMINIRKNDFGWIDKNIVSINIIVNGEDFASSIADPCINNVRFQIMNFPHRMESTLNELFQRLRQVLISKILTLVSVVKVSIKYLSSNENLLLGVKVYLKDLIRRVLSNDCESCHFFIISFWKLIFVDCFWYFLLVFQWIFFISFQ